jgi:DNA-binding transcriptional ArsR family regulator
LGNLPFAYSWIALLCAGASKMDERAPDVQSNLYGCLVGGVHSGKTQGGDTAIRVLGIERPQLLDAFIGSGEALARECAEADGNPRLFAPDELGHMLEKMRIERSGFSFLITRAWDRTQFYNFMGKKESRDFNCDLSILGGVVEERFQELFNFSTTAGVYDRFLFGLCPGNFHFSYRPFSGMPEKITLRPVEIHPELWDWRDDFLKQNRDMNPRVIQMAIRAAVVCAAFDDVHLLGVQRMEPHVALARDQMLVRNVVKPNPGENFEAQIAHKILDYLQAHPGWNKRRELYRNINATDKGPSTFERALDVLLRQGLVVQKKFGRCFKLRLAAADEEVEEED